MTTEYTYDAQVLKHWFLEQLAVLPQVTVLYNHRPEQIRKAGSVWQVKAGDITAEAPYLLNAAYAGVNDVHALLELPPFKIKYEKCEIILCTVDERLKGTGITVMDGPFFSLMPFGQTGLHSLTSVTFTPHETSYDSVATFPCSLFSMKPILKASEIDDSRPTVVRVMCEEPKLVSVLSGKINTVYDLDEVLEL